MLSDLVADQVVRIRKRAGLRRDQLADRCQELGMSDLTEAALANIETGRRDRGTGKRRRRVTVEELLALALALDVPPVSLLADPRTDGAAVPVREGVDVDPWRALLWIVGKQHLDDPEYAKWNVNSPDWVDAETPLSLAYRVASSVQLYRREQGHRDMVGVVPHESPDNRDRQILQGVRAPLSTLVSRGYRVPPLPSDVVERACELGVTLPGYTS